jgi:3-dehydroquinate dehydratase-1
VSKTITVRNVAIGEDLPKICVSLTGKTAHKLMEEAQLFTTLDIDLVEWRVDFFEQVEDLAEVKKTLQTIRSVLGNLPLIFTFRSLKEGGEREVSATYYRDLNAEIVKTGMADLIDVELFQDETTIRFLVESAHTYGVLVIISNHDFKKTPSQEEIILRLTKALHSGGDIQKIAVMPFNSRDVLTLLTASNTFTEQFPESLIITMAMGNLGKVSRVSGGLFGSAVTFGSVGKGSAPGQVTVPDLKYVLNLLNPKKEPNA